jgi:hypothetical protein
MLDGDWSSDVCSSDLGTVESVVERVLAADREGRIRATETLLTDLARALEDEATREDAEPT